MLARTNGATISQSFGATTISRCDPAHLSLGAERCPIYAGLAEESQPTYNWKMVKALTPNNPNDEPDPAPFKVHLLTRAGRLMRARSEPVRAFATKDEAVRFAGRQLGGHYAVYHKDRKIWPAP